MFSSSTIRVRSPGRCTVLSKSINAGSNLLGGGNNMIKVIVHRVEQLIQFECASYFPDDAQNLQHLIQVLLKMLECLTQMYGKGSWHSVVSCNTYTCKYWMFYAFVLQVHYPCKWGIMVSTEDACWCQHLFQPLVSVLTGDTKHSPKDFRPVTDSFVTANVGAEGQTTKVSQIKTSEKDPISLHLLECKV